MRFMPWLVSIGLIIAGVIFAANSTLYNGLSATYTTNWGHVAIGTICILLARLRLRDLAPRHLLGQGRPAPSPGMMRSAVYQAIRSSIARSFRPRPGWIEATWATRPARWRGSRRARRGSARGVGLEAVVEDGLQGVVVGAGDVQTFVHDHPGEPLAAPRRMTRGLPRAGRRTPPPARSHRRGRGTGAGGSGDLGAAGEGEVVGVAGVSAPIVAARAASRQSSRYAARLASAGEVGAPWGRWGRRRAGADARPRDPCRGRWPGRPRRPSARGWYRARPAGSDRLGIAGRPEDRRDPRRGDGGEEVAQVELDHDRLADVRRGEGPH